MKNASMRTKLIFGFGVVIFFSIAAGVFALFQLRAANDNLRQVVVDGNTKLALAKSLSTEIRIGLESILTTGVVSDASAIKAATEMGLAAEQRFRKGQAEIRNLYLGDPQALKLVDVFFEVEKNRSTPDFGRYIQLAQSGQREEASAWLTSKALPSMQALQDSISKIVDYQSDQLEAIRESNERDYIFAFNATAIGLAFSLVIGILTALGFSRHLQRELGAEPSDLGAIAKRISDGDLRQSISVGLNDKSSVLASMARMQSNLSGVVADVRENSENVASASTQIATGNADLSHRTEEQASALQETAATTDQLGVTVRNNADSARQASQLAQDAARVAKEGGTVVGEVVGTMQVIRDSSSKIGDIIGVIDGIAFQTNILALNAAVEAARAGEQGRGFAVVAGEVRNLAHRSAEAAKEIKNLITHNVEQVEQGTTLVDKAGKTMGEIVSSITRVSDIVGEISLASQEQSDGIQQVGNAISQMDQVTQQNAALVEESAAAAASLKSQAQHLVQAVAFFKLAGGGNDIIASPEVEDGAAHRLPLRIS